MEIGETLLVQNAQEWRAWLAEHHHDKKEIWLIYYKKTSGKRGISYEESVDEALCFGWIDGTNKRIDAETYAGRFTPRRPKSHWTETNLAKVARLAREGRMTEAGLGALPEGINLHSYCSLAKKSPGGVPVRRGIQGEESNHRVNVLAACLQLS